MTDEIFEPDEGDDRKYRVTDDNKLELTDDGDEGEELTFDG